MAQSKLDQLTSENKELQRVLDQLEIDEKDLESKILGQNQEIGIFKEEEKQQFFDQISPHLVKMCITEW